MPTSASPCTPPSTQPSVWSDALLHRFFLARKGHIPAAVDMFMNFLAWREAYGVDDLARQSPMPFHDVIDSLIAHRIHKADQQGRPLYFQRTGQIDVGSFISRVPEAVLVLTHIHFMERCQAALHSASLSSHTRQMKLVNIIDTKGLSLSHAKMVRVFRYTATADQAFYPEQLGAFYMVNAPSLLPYIWNLAKPYLDAKTQDKVFILGGAQAMRDVIQRLGVDSIPTEYGGTCKCEGGCIPTIAVDRKDDEEVKAYEKEEVGVVEEVVVVGAGKVYGIEVDVKVDEGCETRVWWSVRIEKKDIGVQALYTGPGGEVSPLTQPRKVEAGAGEGCGVVRGLAVLTDVGVGKVKLALDNSYSRFTSKEVRVRMGVKVIEVTLDEALAGLQMTEEVEAVRADIGEQHCSESRGKAGGDDTGNS